MEGNTVDTAMRICEMRYAGRNLVMDVIDFAECENDRLDKEAYWISQNPKVVNKCRYEKRLAK